MTDASSAPRTALQTSLTPSTLSSEALLDALKMILTGTSLADVLTSITLLIEAHSNGMLCSIFLVQPDGVHLRYAAVPTLPQAYRNATDGTVIGLGRGPCSMAAYRREPVFVADFLSDPDWQHFREKPVAAGLLSGWSNPIIGHDGRVLGTFGMYFREVRKPNQAEIQLIAYASHVAGMAIERDRSQDALKSAFDEVKKSEAELRQIVDSLPHHCVVLGSDGSVEYSNRTVIEYLGLSVNLMKSDFREQVFHPEDLKKLREKRRISFAGSVPWENEVQVLRHDGQYRWFLIRYNPLFDENGSVTRWVTAGWDIEDRKRSEERLQNENLALREEIDRTAMYEAIVGSSASLRKVLSQVDRVAPTDSTVLITGETGTGKELIASAIQKRSKRAGRAFIRVNCAAIPPSLIASELFGYEKGAFTGALQRRAGRFESADGGTIFLDEIGDLAPETQIAILRVLQEREVERVGSSESISVDVRVLAATNRDLEAAVAAGTFREDLFYRLNVFPMRVPSLRERKDDIPLLTEYFVERYAKKAGKTITRIGKKTLTLFQNYGWPGNIRELQNVVERAVILCDGEDFTVEEAWLPRSPNGLSERIASRDGVLAKGRKALASEERKVIEDALAECRGRVAGPRGAAAKLGIPHQTLESKITHLGIDKRRFKA